MLPLRLRRTRNQGLGHQGFRGLELGIWNRQESGRSGKRKQQQQLNHVLALRWHVDGSVHVALLLVEILYMCVCVCVWVCVSFPFKVILSLSYKEVLVINQI